MLNTIFATCCHCAKAKPWNFEGSDDSFLWLAGLLALAFILVLLFRYTPLNTKRHIWNFLNHYLWTVFIVVWIFGFITYCIGSYISGPSQYPFVNALAVVPMAIIHATAMFLGQSDISAIGEPQTHNLYYMFCFNLSHILAVFCSMVFVLHQFGFYIIGRIRIWFASILTKPENLYIFWGISEPALILANSIKDKNDGKIVFVRTFDDEDSHSENMGFNRVFSMVKLKNKAIDELRKLDCYVTTSFHLLSKVDVGNSQIPILTSRLHISSLARLIKHTQNGVHFFMLSEDESINIKCVDKIVRDSTLNDFASNNSEKHVTIYCHARNNSLSRVEEDMHTKQNVEVKILDSSLLSVGLLKITGNGKYQPVSFVDIDTTNNLGTVKSTFHSLIVGFGETGRDAFRFLYEYSAFLDASSTKQSTKRSPFFCDIVDERMSEIKPFFKERQNPALKDEDLKNNNCFINFHDYGYNSQDFNTAILSADNLRALNYVVISLGNDENGMILAVRLLQQTARVRKDLSRFKIFLRVYNGQRAKEIQHIADHYNLMYSNGGNAEFIVPFGSPEQIFTYEFIVADKFRRDAKRFHQQYIEILENRNPNDHQDTWEERRAKLLNRSSNEKTIAENLQKLHRQESQDVANAQHRFTKDFIDAAVHANRLTYDQEKTLKRNLAITEHLRWNAAHEMLGYVYGGDDSTACNELALTHNCLVPWEKLDNVSQRSVDTGYNVDYKEFDYAVVDTSRELNEQ